MMITRRRPVFVVSPTRSLSVDVRRLKVDVVVAGGGMVGSAAAAALAQLGQQVETDEDHMMVRALSY